MQVQGVRLCTLQVRNSDQAKLVAEQVRLVTAACHNMCASTLGTTTSHSSNASQEPRELCRLPHL